MAGSLGGGEGLRGAARAAAPAPPAAAARPAAPAPRLRVEQMLPGSIQYAWGDSEDGGAPDGAKASAGQRGNSPPFGQPSRSLSSSSSFGGEGGSSPVPPNYVAEKGAEDRPGDAEEDEDEDSRHPVAASPEAQATASWEQASPSSPSKAKTFPEPGTGAEDFFSCRLKLPPQMADSDSQRHALCLAPLPFGKGSMKARFMRVRGTGLFATPRFFLFVDNEGTAESVLLASAQRTSPIPAAAVHIKPYYVISSHPHEQRFDRGSPHFLARLAGNMMCTQYVLHGRGLNPEKAEARSGESPRRVAVVGADGAGAASGSLREELMELRFKKPTDAPRSMEVALPKLRSDNTRTQLRPRRPDREGLSLAWEERGNSEADFFQRLASPAAAWDAERKVYAMNFHGRVSRASAKNFQLAPAGQGFQPEGSPMCMQFGRVDLDNFNLDVGYPLSPVQAFALGLSMFDHRNNTVAARLAETLRMYY